ncbi:8953_t:CDS:2 [Diversispora eburnea]|uniref:8953_t:CDS:1 n=1 Tax=Diversispora eburnea TaxID=1213867 RepID=A0A9N9AH45_9GLOM|nr:8953_t:CDS:2 [Diversispora eburnea]
MLLSITLTALASAVVISASAIENKEPENWHSNGVSDQETNEEVNNAPNDSRSRRQIFKQYKKFESSSSFIIKEKQKKRNSVISKQHTRLESIAEETETESINEEPNNESLSSHNRNSARRKKRSQTDIPSWKVLWKKQKKNNNCFPI